MNTPELSTIILILHVVLLSSSLLAVVFMSLLALVGKSTTYVARISVLLGALIGVGTGGLLLIASPTPASCVKLTAFLLAFVGLYAYVEYAARHPKSTTATR